MPHAAVRPQTPLPEPPNSDCAERISELRGFKVSGTYKHTYFRPEVMYFLTPSKVLKSPIELLMTPSQAVTVDDINPALPIIRNIP